eukprot:TRINITY_DN67575_c0_g1_i1.p1 TRINITY_DN67575_c0_g1~~TRINITY_DN67575_c0_g1_i1.p1  ORF type:complete len:781 (+),score=141.39 TRINITY_DN67575_c0_g1_i1:295-2637(+)
MAEQELEPGQELESVEDAAAALLYRAREVLEAHQHAEVSEEEVEALTLDLEALIDDIKPSAEMALEFRQKWEKQKEALISSRESDIERYLAQESEAVSTRVETVAKDELEALQLECSQSDTLATEELSAEHEATIRRAVSVWRDKVVGASQVRASAIDDVVRAAMRRLYAWSDEEERFIMEGWEEELTKTIAAVHKLDEEALTATERVYRARCSVLDAALKKQQKDLFSFRSEYQDQLADMTNKTLALPSATSNNWFKTVSPVDDSGSRSIKPPVHHRPPPSATRATLDKLMQRRIAIAKSEAIAASEAHTRTLVDQLAEIALKEQEHLRAFQIASAKVNPELETMLDRTLTRLSHEAEEQAAARAAHEEKKQRDRSARTRGTQRSGHHVARDTGRLHTRGVGHEGDSHSHSPSHEENYHSYSFNVELGRESAPRASMPVVYGEGWQAQHNDRSSHERHKQGRQFSNVDGRGAVGHRGPSSGGRGGRMQAYPPSSRRTSSRLSREGVHPLVPSASGEHSDLSTLVARSAMHDERDQDGSDVTENASTDEDQTRVARKREIAQARKRAKELEAAVLGTDRDELRKELADLGVTGHGALKGAEAALEAQAKVLRSAGSSHRQSEDEQKAGSQSHARLMNFTGEYAVNIRQDFARARNMKVALSRARAAAARETQQRHNAEVMEFEDELLPAMSKLAHEAERALEVGYALRRGADRIPIGVISGAWRQTITVSLHIIEHIWRAGELEKSECDDFMANLVDTLLKAPGALQQLQQSRGDFDPSN